jgi:phosphoglycerate dehydrogenase-like enzyme
LHYFAKRSIIGAMTRVLLTEHAAQKLAPQLAELGVEPVILAGRVDDIEVAWGSSDLFRSRELTRKFFGITTRTPTLKWVQFSGAGTDDPVFGRLIDNGVLLTTSHVTGPTIAEYVMRAVLDWFQQAERWRTAQRERDWREHEFREVLGTTWLVIGMGSIGVEVAKRAGAFGAHVIGVRRSPRADEPVEEMLTPDAVHQALPRADVVVLALPAGASTANMVDDTFLRQMKPGSVLVNIARGSLVDEAALLSALERGAPEAALLDVTADEPLPDDSPIWTHPQIVLTAHSSGLGDGRHDRAAAFFIENLTRYLKGEPLKNLVGPEETTAGR